MTVPPAVASTSSGYDAGISTLAPGAGLYAVIV
jgi:hypothetical protein